MASPNDRPERRSKTGVALQPQCNEMSQHEDLSVSNSLEITVTVLAIENMDTCKVNEIMIKTEFAGQTLCQSDKLKVSSQNLNVDLIGVIQNDDVDVEFINTLLGNPVLFTVYDFSSQSIIPEPLTVEKDVKKKSAKTTSSRASIGAANSAQNILGICSLDIGDLLTEKTLIRETLLLEFEKNIWIQSSVTWNKLPRLRVVASMVDGGCLTQFFSESNNILGITIESLYNPPDHITEGAAFDALLTMPNFGDKNNMIFSCGLATSVKDSNPRKKWSSLDQMVQGRGGRAKENIREDSHDIISSLSNNTNLELEMNKTGIRIEWNSWRRCLLSRTESNYVSSKLMKYHVWPVEIVGSDKNNGQKTAKVDKKSKPGAESNSSSDHFTAFLNFSSLLYPGVTKVRAAAPLLPYSQSDLAIRFGAEFPVSNSQASVATINKSKGPSEKSKTSTKDIEEKKAESTGFPVTNKDGVESFIVVEIELWKPLTRQKNPEYLEKELKSYVSLKDKASKKNMNLRIVQESFSKTVQEFTCVISQEYVHFIELEKNNCKKSEPKNLTANFHNYLECRESFNSVIKCLESDVLALVREKHRSSSYNENIPDIYASIVEEMFNITNDGFWNANHSSRPRSGVSECDKRQFFVEEALEEGDYEGAKRNLLRNITKHKNHSEYWLDYAVFCIKTENYEKAVEGVREALSLDIYNPRGLLLYGSLMTMLKNGTIAETVLQFLTFKYPYLMEGWKALWFFYVTFENFQRAEVVKQMSIKLEHEKRKDENLGTHKSSLGSNGGVSFKKEFTWKEPLAWTISFCPPENINLRTALFMMTFGLYELASMILSEELLKKKDEFCLYYQYYLSVVYYLQGHYEESIRELEVAVREFGKDCHLWSLMGHCYYKIQDHVNAFACYEYVIESYNRPDDIHLIYLRIGFYYLEKKKALCAKQVFATGCKYSPSPKMWKGAGIALLLATGNYRLKLAQLKEYKDAETAFGEANYLDNEDPETWGYLALVNGQLRRLDILNHCYLEAKKRKLNNQNIVDEIERCIGLNRMEFGEN